MTMKMMIIIRTIIVVAVVLFEFLEKIAELVSNYAVD